MMKWKVTRGPRCASADRSSDYLRKVEDLPDPNRTRSTFSSNDFSGVKANGGVGQQQGKAERDIVPLSENRKRSQQNPESSRKSSSFVTTDCINFKGIFGISRDRSETPYKSLAAPDNGRRRSRSEARGTSIDRLTVAYHATPLIGPQHYIPQNLQQNGGCKTSSTTITSKKLRSSSPGEKSGCWVRGRRRERDSTRESETDVKAGRRTVTDSCKKSLNSNKLLNGRTVTDSSGPIICNGDVTRIRDVDVAAENVAAASVVGKENIEINNNDERYHCHQQPLKEEDVPQQDASKTVEIKPKKNRKKRIAPKPQRVSFADDKDDKKREDPVTNIADHPKISDSTSSSSSSSSSSSQAERMMATGIDDSSVESPVNEQPLSITSEISEMECQDDAEHSMVTVSAVIHDDFGQRAENLIEDTGQNLLEEDQPKHAVAPQINDTVANSAVSEFIELTSMEYLQDEMPIDAQTRSLTNDDHVDHGDDDKGKEYPVVLSPDVNENSNKDDPPNSGDMQMNESDMEKVPDVKELTFSHILQSIDDIAKISDTYSDDTEHQTESRNSNDSRAADKSVNDAHGSLDYISESNTDEARTDLDSVLDASDSICGDGRVRADSSTSIEHQKTSSSESPEPPPRKKTTKNHGMRVNVVVKSPKEGTKEDKDGSPEFVVKKSFVLTVAKQAEGFRSLCARKDTPTVATTCEEREEEEEPVDKKTTITTTQQISVTFLCATPKNGSNNLLVNPNSTINDSVRLRSLSMPPTNGFADAILSSAQSTSSSHRSFSKDRRPKDRQSAKRKSHRSRKKDNPFNSMPQAVIDELAQVLEHRRRAPDAEAC